ncbi:MAG: hypothetical protein WC244_02320 [Patescibacteria group bacterium]|jgi:hypothetical protein
MLFNYTDDKSEIGKDYFSLEEAAKKFSFTLKYLMNMVSKGKLKAFKIHDVWYTSEAWIHEHKREVVNLIDHEIEHSREYLKHLQKWVRSFR